MRIVFLGTGDFGVPALAALRAAGHEILAAVSQPDRPAGRGRAVQPTPIHAAADAAELRHIQCADVNALDFADAFGDAELGVVVAFGQKIGGGLLDYLPRGCVNIHGSLLPKYRGAAPFQWAMIRGEEETGVTVFQLNERWDAGGILGTRSTPIRPDETAEELHDRLAELGAALIVEVVADLAAGRAQPQPQDAGQATRAPKLSKTDGVVDWERPAGEVVRRIHGLWSWPAAACVFASRGGKRERLLLARAAVADPDARPDDVPPGTFREDRTVQAGQGTVRLVEVRPAGKKLMPFEAFANGRDVGAGDRLLSPEEA
jgi:methionyl-tRNA formyltransferase